MSMASRLRSAREAKGLEPAQVSERLGLSEGAVRHHENGTRNPKTKTIAQYSRLYGVSVDWIMRGAGVGPHPSDAAEFIDLFEALPEDERPLVLDVMRAAAKRAKSTGKRGG
jgi:transcriptional regulator with XRE-family HTH domain